ncbi:hypothetical protein GE09DRAFT_83859 [Coniochaeta sp. 2T2.1]|nr:hypothetical protein GE09DRAFT_83859 [Coniochaeta sp. 2T2.1]
MSALGIRPITVFVLSRHSSHHCCWNPSALQQMMCGRVDDCRGPKSVQVALAYYYARPDYERRFGWRCTTATTMTRRWRCSKLYFRILERQSPPGLFHVGSRSYLTSCSVDTKLKKWNGGAAGCNAARTHRTFPREVPRRDHPMSLSLTTTYTFFSVPKLKVNSLFTCPPSWLCPKSTKLPRRGSSGADVPFSSIETYLECVASPVSHTCFPLRRRKKD